MVDMDYYLPVVLKNYFVYSTVGKGRVAAFFNTTAAVLEENADLADADLALIVTEKIMNTSAPFAADGGQTKDNLIHLKKGKSSATGEIQQEAIILENFQTSVPQPYNAPKRPRICLCALHRWGNFRRRDQELCEARSGRGDKDLMHSVVRIWRVSLLALLPFGPYVATLIFFPA
jgi:hypothetical protein